MPTGCQCVLGAENMKRNKSGSRTRSVDGLEKERMHTKNCNADKGYNTILVQNAVGTNRDVNPSLSAGSRASHKQGRMLVRKVKESLHTISSSFHSLNKYCRVR